MRDRYRLVELLVQGANGLTFLAHHEFLNHPCVVKLLPCRIEHASDGAARRLRSEASAGFRVNHPNVVRVLDGDTIDGVWYFVMEYVDGVDLGTVAEAGIRVEWRQTLRFAIEAARGLDAIHRAGLIHRDIKPSNLMLDTEGRLRVADLGVAQLVQDRGATAGSTDAGTVGTLPYAAPELFATSARVTAAADLYSLGASLLELVAGAVPRGGSVYRTILGDDQHPVVWPSESAEEVPQWLREVILRLVEAAPDKRFPSSAALLERLEHADERPAAVTVTASLDRSDPLGLVVLPFENASRAEADDWLGHALADHLSRALVRRHGVYVANLDQYLQTLARVKERRARPRAEQWLEAGRLIGAARVIEGSFRRDGETIELTARTYRSGSSQVENIGPVSGALAALPELETELHQSLARQLDLRDLEATTGSKPVLRVSHAAEERFFSAKRAFFHGDYETAIGLGKEAIALDANFGEAVGFVGVCHARLGRYDEAVEYNRRQQMLAAELGDERLKVEAQANLGSMHYFRGEYEAANECLTRAARVAETLGLTTELASIRNNLGFVLLQLGRQAEAAETYLQAVETLRKYGALVPLIGPYNGMGHVLCEQKRYDDACSYFRRALALAQESDDYVNMGVAYMNLGHSALLQGRLDDAKHELATALNILEHTSFWNGLARVYEYMADLNLRLCNCAEAARCAEMRIELARRHSNVRMEAAARQQLEQARTLGGAAVGSGRPVVPFMNDAASSVGG